MKLIKKYFFEHSSGTKFYELMLFNNVDTKGFALVKRWGKNEGSVVRGFGAILTESFTSESYALHALVTEFDNRKKRGYVQKRCAVGMHDVTEGSYIPVSELAVHYKGSTKGKGTHLDQVLHALGLGIETAGEIHEEDFPVEPPVVTPAEPKYDNWGAW